MSYTVGRLEKTCNQKNNLIPQKNKYLPKAWRREGDPCPAS